MNTLKKLGLPLSKSVQKSIHGGGGVPPRGCYPEPVADVDCVLPWQYVPSCGYVCLSRPGDGPNGDY